MSVNRPQRMPLALATVALLAAFVSPAPGDTVQVSTDQPLQQAINAASEGDTLLLAAGDHRGPVTVTRSITLHGEAGARIVGTGEGSVLTIEADGACIEQLEVRRSGRNLSRDDAGILVLADNVRIAEVRLHDNLHGIYVRRANHAQLLNNTVVGLAATEDKPAVEADSPAHLSDGIHHNPPSSQSLMGNGLHLWNAQHATVAGNHIHHARDGIYVAHTRYSTFRNNRIHDSRYGIHYMYSSDNTIANNELWRNVAGPALMFSRDLEIHGNVMRDHSGFRAYGLLLQDIQNANIQNNEIRGNRAGMRLQQSSANTFTDNRIFGNLAGLTINSSSRDNTFTRNAFGMNLHQVELTGPPPPTQWSVDGVGNRWHGAMPMDLTGDGIAEWPHHEVDLMAERRERFPYVQLLTGSPGIRAMEWALKRAPVPGLRYITDPHPLTRGGRR